MTAMLGLKRQGAQAETPTTPGTAAPAQQPAIEGPATVLNVFGEDSRLSGRVSGQDFTILGHFEGELQATGRLRIGPAAVVRARVQAAAVEIEGDFEGEVRSDLLRFGRTARAKGEFLAERLSLQEGALVNGPVNLQPARSTATVDEATAEPSVEAPETIQPKAQPRPVSVARRSGVAGRKVRGRGRRRPGRLSVVAGATKRRMGHARQYRVAVPARRALTRLG
jgi:cytoskeletal protein CcmA (bactofilin family)